MDNLDVKRVRYALQMTKTELAAALGVSNQLIHGIESGKDSVSKKTAAKLWSLLEERNAHVDFAGSADATIYNMYMSLSPSDKNLINGIIRRFVGADKAEKSADNFAVTNS